MKSKLIAIVAAVVLVGCGEMEEAKRIDFLSSIAGGNIAAVKQYLAKGIDLHELNQDGWNPLHSAASHGREEIAELLIAAGADVNFKDGKGRTPLDLADWETEDLLRKHGGKYGSLHKAAAAGHLENVKELLAAGTDVNAKNDRGWTPLRQAAGSGHKEIVELLIANGTNVNAKDEGGMTPLHWAADRGHKEIVELLIANGTDVNAKSKDGWTPLHQAASEGHKETVELLIAKGADVNAKIKDGRTPLDQAEASWSSPNRNEIIDLLCKHGGKTGEELKAEGK